MRIGEFQDLIEEIYYERDSRRGVAPSFVWFTEEIGELARAMRGTDKDNLEEEFADVFAWLSSLASMKGVRLEEAVRKYAGGCPCCSSRPCRCRPT